MSVSALSRISRKVIKYRNYLLKTEGEIVRIQRCVRGYIVHRKYGLLRRAVLLLQHMWRRVMRHRRYYACVEIQRFYRRCRKAKALARIKPWLKVVVTCYKTWRQRRLCQELLQKVVIIQSCMRRAIMRSKHTKYREAIVNLQSKWRKYLIQKEYLDKKRVLAIIQSLYRRNQAMQYRKVYIHAVTRVQRAWRAYVSACRAKKSSTASTAIQSLYRRNQAMQYRKVYIHAVTRVQRAWRAYVSACRGKDSYVRAYDDIVDTAVTIDTSVTMVHMDDNGNDDKDEANDDVWRDNDDIVDTSVTMVHMDDNEYDDKDEVNDDVWRDNDDIVDTSVTIDTSVIMVHMDDNGNDDKDEANNDVVLSDLSLSSESITIVVRIQSWWRCVFISRRYYKLLRGFSCFQDLYREYVCRSHITDVCSIDENIFCLLDSTFYDVCSDNEELSSAMVDVSVNTEYSDNERELTASMTMVDVSVNTEYSDNERELTASMTMTDVSVNTEYSDSSGNEHCVLITAVMRDSTIETDVSSNNSDDHCSDDEELTSPLFPKLPMQKELKDIVLLKSAFGVGDKSLASYLSRSAME